MRTKQEIQTEIATLKALKPVGQFKIKTASLTQIASEELQFGVDQSAEEWDELSDEEQDIAQQALIW